MKCSVLILKAYHNRLENISFSHSWRDYLINWKIFCTKLLFLDFGQKKTVNSLQFFNQGISVRTMLIVSELGDLLLSVGAFVLIIYMYMCTEIYFSSNTIKRSVEVNTFEHYLIYLQSFKYKRWFNGLINDTALTVAEYCTQLENDSYHSIIFIAHFLLVIHL